MDILKELGISQAIDLGEVSIKDSTLPDDWEYEDEEVNDGGNERHNDQGN